MIRPFLSVIAGFATWTVLWLGINAGLRNLFPAWYDTEKLGSVPSLLALVVSALLSLLAGYITATIADAWRPVIILAFIQVLVGTVVSLSYWTMLPLWYHISFLVLLFPLHLLGARP